MAAPAAPPPPASTPPSDGSEGDIVIQHHHPPTLPSLPKSFLLPTLRWCNRWYASLLIRGALHLGV